MIIVANITFFRLVDDNFNIRKNGLLESTEEFYEGADSMFELEAISDNIVSSSTGRLCTLTANENVCWSVSDMKLIRNTQTAMNGQMQEL